MANRKHVSGKFAALVLAVLLAVSAPAPHAHAHPHVWIDLKTELVFSPEAKITGLTIDWTFDELYTAFIIEDVGGAKALDDEKLTGIGRKNLANLREYNYFAEFLVDGAAQEFATPETFDVGLRDGRLWMRFTVPLAAPVTPNGKRISYAVYDPSYYVSILHGSARDAALPADAPAGCEIALEEPNPSSESLSLAQSLDRMDIAPQSYGALFAERIRLTCN